MTLRVALGQYDTGWHDPALSLGRAARVVERAASQGAELVVLPETSTTGFTMESAVYAEAVDGRSASTIAEIAAAHRVYVLAGLATRELDRGQTSFWNSALLFSPTGERLAHYRKQRLFAVGGEDQAYQAGDSAVMVEVHGLKIAPFICYDLRFPELFRPLAPHVDAMILIANWPVARRPHWDVLVQARAIENQCYFVAVNRVGNGNGTPHDGGSVVYGPWGERLAHAGDSDAVTDDISCITLDGAEITRVRERFPFVQDRRALALV